MLMVGGSLKFVFQVTNTSHETRKNGLHIFMTFGWHQSGSAGLLVNGMACV